MGQAATKRVILLVEDDASDELLTLRAFELSHVANPIVVVRDGAEALDYLFMRGAHDHRPATAMPQMILLDLKLPKLGGLDVLKSIRLDERTKLLPVVIFTSSADEQDLIRSYHLGANSFVRKPVDFPQLAEAVKHIGLYWLVLSEPAPSLPQTEA